MAQFGESRNPHSCSPHADALLRWAQPLSQQAEPTVAESTALNEADNMRNGSLDCRGKWRLSEGQDALSCRLTDTSEDTLLARRDLSIQEAAFY